MNQVFHSVKLAVAVCMFVAQPLALPLAAISIAFSVMPE